MENSISNTATKPLAVLLDNRPSNHSEEVTQALDKHEILLMSSTPGRPENKASVEGAFGLFSQTMPDITLPLDSPKALGYAVLSYVLFAYSAGRNQVPRPALGNRSAAEAFRSAHITPEQRKQAKLSLEAIKRRIKQQLKNDWKQTNPTIRGLLFDAFVDMGLSDPQRRFIPAIAKYGLEAATEAIATFKARQNAGTAPTDFPERYLLGIARNIARRNLNEAVYEELLRLRLKANDALLRPLLYEKKRLWRSLSPRDLSLETLERALSSSATIDRAFWKLDFLSTLESLPSLLRQGIARFAAQQVARAFSLPIRERESFIAALAARARPIPQAHQTRPRPTR